MRQPALLLHDGTIAPSTYDKEAITQWLAEQRCVCVCLSMCVCFSVTLCACFCGWCVLVHMCVAFVVLLLARVSAQVWYLCAVSTRINTQSALKLTLHPMLQNPALPSTQNPALQS